MAPPSPWRVVRSLTTLRDQVDARWPGRSKASDGTVADAAHSTTSDHYPHPVPALGSGYFVTALDITNDPGHGLRSNDLADALIASKDPRIKYVISHGLIASNPHYSHAAENWAWRTYSGSDPHTSHMHVSVLNGTIADSTNPWRIDAPGRATGGGTVSTLDRNDIFNVASAVIQWADSSGNLSPDFAGAQYNLKAVADTIYRKLDELTLAPVEFTAHDVAEAILTDARFPALLSEAVASAIAQVRIVVDPAISV